MLCKDIRLSLAQLVMKSSDHALSIIPIKTSDESLLLMMSFYIEIKCAQILSLPISVNLERSAFMHITSSKLSIILVILRQESAPLRCMIVANTAAGLRKMRKTDFMLKSIDNLFLKTTRVRNS